MFGAPRQQKQAQATAANASVTLDSTPLPGTLLVAFFRPQLANASITGPTNWSQAVVKDDSPGPLSSHIWYKVADDTDTTSVAFTHASAAYALEVVEFPGPKASPLDTSSSFDAATVATVQPGSITPAVTRELFCCMAGNNNTNGGSAAIDSGFTVIDGVTNTIMVIGYKIKTDAAAENPHISWLTARNSNAVMACFKPGLALPVQPPRVRPNLMRAR